MSQSLKNSLSQEQLQAKLARLELEKKKRAIEDGLPHLYGYPWYDWAWDFFKSENKDCFLVAANQISKSSTQIRKFIDWATDVKEWKRRWPLRPTGPKQFWYLYPTKDVVDGEVETKWIPEFLPRDAYKSSSQYGWEIKNRNKHIDHILFNNGMRIVFKTYATDVHHLQSGTVDMIGFDEELPEDLYEELNFRRQAIDGYLCGVFTATRGQEFWRLAIEEIGTSQETFTTAFKQQVSMYDCMLYRDGSPSRWTKEKIQRAINACKSEAEVKRRVFGRFVADSGLKYPSFERAKNVRKKEPLPHDWLLYAGVDIGQGGSGHPASIAFVAVNPQYTRGRVFLGWRGDGLHTANSDILEKFCQMRGSLKMTAQYYDWHSKDFFLLATRRGVPFIPAEKSQDLGVQTLNVLFKNDMLCIDEDEELEKLAVELTTLREETPKTKAKDDFIDALRYAVTKIPWDYTAIKSEALEQLKVATAPIIKPKTEIDLRREAFIGRTKEQPDTIEEELEAWGELY